jgi:large subunit ribosomal protein L29
MASTKEIRDLGSDEIEVEIRQLREQLFKLRWQAATGQVENPNRIRQVKRDIARRRTILRERAGGRPPAAASGEKA